MEKSSQIRNASHYPDNISGGNSTPYSVELLEKASADADTVLKELGSQLNGLSEEEADSPSEEGRD